MSSGWDNLDDESRKRFEKRGRNPRAWRQVALDLHRAAGLLWDRTEGGTDTTEKTDWFISVGKIALLLEGFAIEMLAKAMMVGHDPGLVTEGQWKGPKQGHPLSELLDKIGSRSNRLTRKT